MKSSLPAASLAPVMALLATALSAVGQHAPRHVRSFATDGEGQVWGLVSMSSSTAPFQVERSFRDVATFTPSTASWRVQACPAAPANGHAQCLTALSEGAIACLWQDDTKSVLTIWQRGKCSRWSTLDAVFAEPRLLPLSDGGLAITERGPQVARIAANGDSVLNHIPDDMMARPKQPDASRSYGLTHAVECGDGSLWLWSYALEKHETWWCIDGFIRWTTSGIERIKGLPFKPGSPISAVVADGKEHLFAAEAGASLVRLHIPDGKAQKVRTKDADLTHVERLAFVNGFLHVVTCPKPNDVVVTLSKTMESSLLIDTTRHYEAGQRTGTLWRIRGLTIEKLIQGLDARPRFGWADRPLVATGKGLLVGAVESAPWWLPASGGKPFLFDEAQGFGLPFAEEMAGIGKDRLLARSDVNLWAVSGLPGDKSLAVATRIAELHFGTHLLQDRRLHLWALNPHGDGLAEWDGQAWHTRDKPDGVDEFNILEFVADSHDRGWLIPRDCGNTRVLDFTTGRWRVFDSLEQTVAELLLPGEKLAMHRDLLFAPVSHRNGNQAFLDWDGVLHAHMRGRWTRTSIHNIADAGARATGGPFFDEQGSLRLPLAYRHYQLRNDGKWVQADAENHTDDRTCLPDHETPPPDGPVPQATSTTLDRHGVAWLTTDAGELWKSLDGATVKLTDEGRPRLLPPHTLVAEVLTDPAHNAFLRHSFAIQGISYTQISVRPAPILMPATVTSLKDDAFVIQLSPAPGLWHRWRLDKAAWHPPAHQTEIKLKALPIGRHSLDIEVFDAELNPVGDTQTLTFTAEAVGPDGIAQQIQRLQSASLEARESAAHVLEAQGDNSLPALKQALKDPKGDATLQWWLSAVIQHIEDHETKRR